MFEKLAQALAAGLSLWESKEKTKYVDKILDLKKEWYEEYQKPIGVRSDDQLARIEHELCLVCDAFTASIAAKSS
jgi:hypothetical protein